MIMQQQLALMLILVSTIAMVDCSCSNPANGTCDFYVNCLETAFQCGPSGYPLGYGYYYCQKFETQKFTPQGEVWVKTTASCLQQKLVPLVQDDAGWNCSSLTDYAFDTHPVCYTTPGASVCNLPISDVLKVLRVLKLKDIFDKRALKQMERVMEKCVMGRPDFQILIDFLNNQQPTNVPN
eukprot:TRINITY_DN9807_c0_g1_i1.p1 TRINITY_DN9807_c0_g1~~TRINITY_DN9807_c0_g1_i1.p1  ORF type:complete len:181 (+),score=24.61 TRINITY_DN9807_c0_g1_i1:48-590(+)